MIVVGGGIAGMYAALCAAAETDVVLLTKGPLLDLGELSGAGRRRRGGRGGRLARAARRGHAARRARALPAERGRGADRGGAGARRRPRRPRRPVRRRARARGRAFARRVVHAGGAATGAVIARVLAARVLEHPRIRVHEGERVARAASPAASGPTTEVLRAPATLLATGGYSALWERTTNPPGSVGDGIVLAYRAGAARRRPRARPVPPDRRRRQRPAALGGAARRGRAAARRARRALHRRARAPGRRRTRDRRARNRAARPPRHRPRALPDADGRARLARLRSRPRPDSRLAGGALLDGRRRHRPRRPHGRRRRVRRRRVRVHRRPRREPPRIELAARMPRLRPPSRARRPLRPAAVPCNKVLQGTTRPGSTRSTPELRAEMWRDAGLLRDAAGLGELAGSPHTLARLIAKGGLAREESRGGHFRTDFPFEDEALRRTHRHPSRHRRARGARAMELTVRRRAAPGSPRTSARATRPATP